MFSLFYFIYFPQRIPNRRDTNGRIPRSSSIDSMVEAVWNETPRTSLTPTTLPVPQPHQQQQQQQPTPTPQYLQINYGNTGSNSRRESLLSPSAGRRNKQNRSIAGKSPTSHDPTTVLCNFFHSALLQRFSFLWLLLLCGVVVDWNERARLAVGRCRAYTYTMSLVWLFVCLFVFRLLCGWHECRLAQFKNENKTATTSYTIYTHHDQTMI